MSEPFAVITPHRSSERNDFLNFCIEQVSRMTVKPAQHYIIDYHAVNKLVDIIPRLKLGIEYAKADGIDLVFILEDDDFYGPRYFENIDFDADFIGEPITTYYSLRNNTWTTFDHPHRSSLFTTGFRISALDGYKWPADDFRNVDVALWAANQRKRIQWRQTGAIGIKHGIGMAGGSFHGKTMKNIDKDWAWLAEHTDPYAYAFYKTLQL